MKKTVNTQMVQELEAFNSNYNSDDKTQRQNKLKSRQN